MMGANASASDVVLVHCRVQDIIIMVGFVLSVQPNGCDLQAADSDNDSTVTVNDITNALTCLVSGAGENCLLSCE